MIQIDLQLNNYAILVGLTMKGVFLLPGLGPTLVSFMVDLLQILLNVCLLFLKR